MNNMEYSLHPTKVGKKVRDYMFEGGVKGRHFMIPRNSAREYAGCTYTLSLIGSRGDAFIRLDHPSGMGFGVSIEEILFDEEASPVEEKKFVRFEETVVNGVKVQVADLREKYQKFLQRE